MTEPDQKDKDPEPAGKWVNAQTMIPVNPEMEWEEGWEEVWVEQPEELPGTEPEEEPGEARVEIPGKTKFPEQM